MIICVILNVFGHLMSIEPDCSHTNGKNKVTRVFRKCRINNNTYMEPLQGVRYEARALGLQRRLQRQEARSPQLVRCTTRVVLLHA